MDTIVSEIVDGIPLVSREAGQADVHMDILRIQQDGLKVCLQACDGLWEKISQVMSD